jgi:hypothetical protein
MNVSLNDIKEIETQLNIQLTNEQRDSVLKGYQRIVMDRAESWSAIIENLIKEYERD